MARVVSINISTKKGVKKTPVSRAKLIAGVGIEGDAHALKGTRQVSLLSIEDIKRTNLNPGDFAENITIEGVDLSKLKVGTIIKIGDARLKISQIGKECHTCCAIYKKVGDCIMPTQGIFARIVTGGSIHVDDEIVVEGSIL